MILALKVTQPPKLKLSIALPLAFFVWKSRGSWNYLKEIRAGQWDKIFTGIFGHLTGFLHNFLHPAWLNLAHSGKVQRSLPPALKCQSCLWLLKLSPGNYRWFRSEWFSFIFDLRHICCHVQSWITWNDDYVLIMGFSKMCLGKQTARYKKSKTKF